ncbi:hypothetical protein DMUE_3042 [Dictyocoela muelleri]|nr:hypothetical protein DMUE_3042 [Dictyocoela muelleri]
MNEYLMYINHIKLENVKKIYFDNHLIPRIIPRDKNKIDLYEKYSKFEDCIEFFESLRPEDFGGYKSIVNFYKSSYKNMNFDQLCRDFKDYQEKRCYNERLENIYLSGVTYIGNGGEFYIPAYNLASFYFNDYPEIAKIYLKEALNVAKLSNSSSGVKKCQKFLKKLFKKIKME